MRVTEIIVNTPYGTRDNELFLTRIPKQEPSWWGEDIVPRIRWRIEIQEGAEIPNGYGISYRDPFRCVSIAYPIPINLIVGAAWVLWWRLTCPAWSNARTRVERAAFVEGLRVGLTNGEANSVYSVNRAREDGYSAGYDKGVTAEAENSKRENAWLVAQNYALMKAIEDYVSTGLPQVIIYDQGPPTTP